MASHRRVHSGHRWAGIALPIVLMFLLIITIAAAYGVRRATLGDGITRNQLDYEVARQAAEAALRDGQRDLLSPIAAAPCARGGARPLKSNLTALQWTTACTKGQCIVTPDSLAAGVYASGTNAQPWWPNSKGGRWGDNEVVPASCDFDGGVPLGTFTGTPSMRGVERQPEYLLEFIDRPYDPIIRITARGFGADINTEVVLQAYVRPPDS